MSKTLQQKRYQSSIRSDQLSFISVRIRKYNSQSFPDYSTFGSRSIMDPSNEFVSIQRMLYYDEENFRRQLIDFELIDQNQQTNLILSRKWLGNALRLWPKGQGPARRDPTLLMTYSIFINNTKNIAP